MTWSKERLAALEQLWAAGLPAAEIAAELGGVSRNGVIGKVHRLGLAGRKQPAGKGPTAKRRNPISPARMKPIEWPPITPDDLPLLSDEQKEFIPGKGCTLMELDGSK